MPKPIIVVQGGQYGSEGKGQIAAKFCIDRGVDYAVRTGSINAGHTVYHNGQQYKMQQLPTGWVNPNTQLVIGPGAYIHNATLMSEIAWVNAAMGGDVRDRLWIDKRAGVHLDADQEQAILAGRSDLIGATGKGCAEAIINKIKNRARGYKLYREYPSEIQGRLIFNDTSEVLNRAYDEGKQILIEGTQGTLLDLHLGPYPYTTSRMTTAANWIAEAGLSPSLKYEVALVMRTYPIRVAGNSGPLPNEISWAWLAKEMNNWLIKKNKAPIIPWWAVDELVHQTMAREDAEGLPCEQHMLGEADRAKFASALRFINSRALAGCSPLAHAEWLKLIEMTTVTRLVRRIARWDMDEALKAIRIERPAYIVLSFLNYRFPEYAGITEPPGEDVGPVDAYLEHLETALGVPIKFVTTGPLAEHVLAL